MELISLYCKSFHGDVERCHLLLESVKKHNKDNIPFYISVPKGDAKLFIDKLGTNGYTLLNDEDILGSNLAQSWKNQQIVKMLFWKTSLCLNYVVLDSDSYFIKDFYTKDFIVYDEVPYTIMHEQKDLFQWTYRYKDFLGFDPQQSFAECRIPIQELFGRKGKLLDGGPVPCIWNKNIWFSMEQEYLIPNNLTFNNLIQTIPSEFTWYLEWMLTHPNIIPLYPSEPLFKCFHFFPQYKQFKELGYIEDHWKSNFLGIVMQSSSGLPMKY